MSLACIIFFCGVAHFGILIASALVPLVLDWTNEFECLPHLHQQMYWTYGGYVVLNIIAFGILCTLNAAEIASGSRFGRCFALYVAAFWGIRLMLQGVFDVKEYLTTWWLKLGYHALSLVFLIFTLSFGYAATH